MAHDLVIRGGTIIDGSGAPRFDGDVAIDGGCIVEVGQIGRRGRREIDARGHVVTPGFVDIHSHLDAQIARDPISSSSCYHGITSAVLGNCGVTFAPGKPEDRESLANLMESVEDIPAQSILSGLPWDWETYGEYLASIERMSKGINVGGMVDHCAVRYHAMGDRSLSDAPASADDLARITALVDEAIAAGALGFSTSRTFMHKVPDGRCVPGAFADINVIDVDALDLSLPEYRNDFPVGAGRYVQEGRGYRHVIVDGQPFMENGQHTGALAGVTLRS